jgi:hypothetical protein
MTHLLILIQMPNYIGSKKVLQSYAFFLIWENFVALIFQFFFSLEETFENILC